MNKIYQKPFSDGKNVGFTLIELLVVVLIIGILSAVALPQYRFAVYRARLFRLAPMMKSIKQANQMFYMANGYYTNDFAKWDISLPEGTVFSGNETGYADLILPDGMRFGVVSSPIPGMAWPRVQGNAPDVPAGLWTAYEREEWRCYPQGDLGRRLCKAMGCKNAEVEEGSGCVFNL